MEKARVAWATVAAGLVLLAAGCGGSQSPSEVVGAAAERTTDAGSSRVALRVRLLAEGGAVVFAASGISDYQTQRGRVSFDLRPLGGGRLDLIFDRFLYFVRLPDAARWIRVDMTNLGGARNPGQFDSFQQGDPLQQLHVLRTAFGAREVGMERVRGVETTRYSARASVRRALTLSTSGPGEGRRRAAMERTLGASIDAEVPLELWIDGEGRLRRMDMALATSAEGPAGRVALTVKTRMELFEFGVAVDVARPPAAQTVDLADVGA